MIQQIFTIYDNKAKAFLKPFFTHNEDTAIRMLIRTITEHTDHEFARYSADYELYNLGEYDDHTGQVDPIPPAHVLNLNQLTWKQPPREGADPSDEEVANVHANLAEVINEAVN